VSSKKEPILVKVKHSGLNTDLVLVGNKITGLSVEYQKSRGAHVDRVMGLINGVLNTPLPDGHDPLPSLVEGMAEISHQAHISAPKEPTIMNIRTSGLVLDFVLRKGAVTSMSFDYQKGAKGIDLREIVAMVNNICSVNASEAHHVAPYVAVDTMVDVPSIAHDQDDSHSLGPLLTPEQGKVITEAVDTVLDQLGSDGKEVVLGLLDARYGLRLEDVPNHPRAFVDILGLHVGSAAQLIERDIISEISKDLPVKGKSLHAAVRSLEEASSNMESKRLLEEITSTSSHVELEEVKAEPEEAARVQQTEQAEQAAQPEQPRQAEQTEAAEEKLDNIQSVSINWKSR
jgi:hypothetical protein